MPIKVVCYFAALLLVLSGLDILAPALLLPASALNAENGSKVEINSDHVLVIDGKKVFPIGFAMPPPLDRKAPNGKYSIEELHDAGATFLRTGVFGGAWNDRTIEQEQQWEDAAARYGMHCWVHLRELDSISLIRALTLSPEGTLGSRDRTVPALRESSGIGFESCESGRSA